MIHIIEKPIRDEAPLGGLASGAAELKFSVRAIADNSR
jgi:hypothetical protein